MDNTEERLRAALADKYEVIKELGAGGMALVFLARDIKHDRNVAVKVLRPELSAALGPERFLREIQITAKLSHPHILPLFDSGEADGFLFYVMPFIEGESLSDLIEREKQLSLDEAVRITREVAEGLAHANSHGLVHRDIKPDNIMLSGGHAVIADFGIARAVSEAGGDKLTQTGMAIGTPAYMAPEQVAGGEGVDGRADIYSLGCVLYEMLVGDVPFTGPTPLAVMARHTMDHLTPPSIMRDSISPEIEDIIYCAMAKTPADRFRTAAQLADALKAVEAGGAANIGVTATHARRTLSAAQRPTTQNFALALPWWKRPVLVGGTVAAVATAGLGGWFLSRGTSTPAVGMPIDGLDPRHIAVLYFEDRSPNGEWTHIADGITEQLIENLSSVSELDVVSRNGVSRFRGATINRDSIARALEVGSLVTGSIEPDGNRFRVTTRLVEGASDVELERESFTVAEDDFLSASDSIVGVVAGFLRTRLGEEVRLRNQRGQTGSVEAWTLTQRAERLRKEADVRSATDIAGADSLLISADSTLARASAADPDWLVPILTRGWVAYSRGRLTGMAPEDRIVHYDSAVQFAERGLQKSPNAPEALALRGTARYGWYRALAALDPSGAEDLLTQARTDLEAAVDGNPRLADAQVQLSYLYYYVDDVPQAQLAARAALEEDAYLENASDIMERLFLTSFDLEQFAQARNWCAEGRRRFPADYRFRRCQLFLLASPALTADPEQAWNLSGAIDTLAPATIRERYSIEAQLLVGGVLARAGLMDSARTVLADARARVTSEIDPIQYLLTIEAYARTYMEDADKQVAIDLLLRYKAANPDHRFEESAGTAWMWRPLRAIPRFSQVTSR